MIQGWLLVFMFIALDENGNEVGRHELPNDRLFATQEECVERGEIEVADTIRIYELHSGSRRAAMFKCKPIKVGETWKKISL